MTTTEMRISTRRERGFFGERYSREEVASLVMDLVEEPLYQGILSWLWRGDEEGIRLTQLVRAFTELLMAARDIQSRGPLQPVDAELRSIIADVLTIEGHAGAMVRFADWMERSQDAPSSA